MGASFNKFSEPGISPGFNDHPTFDPMLGFPEGRKPRGENLEDGFSVWQFYIIPISASAGCQLSAVLRSLTVLISNHGTVNHEVNGSWLTSCRPIASVRVIVR